MPAQTDVSIEPFRGDLEGLEKMAHSSWRDEYGVSSFPNLYRPAFLRYLFGRLKQKDHLLAAYRGEEIISFLANLPQNFLSRHNAVFEDQLTMKAALIPHRRGH